MRVPNPGKKLHKNHLLKYGEKTHQLIDRVSIKKLNKNKRMSSGFRCFGPYSKKVAGIRDGEVVVSAEWCCGIR